jgi:hypothetical protein
MDQRFFSTDGCVRFFFRSVVSGYEWFLSLIPLLPDRMRNSAGNAFACPVNDCQSSPVRQIRRAAWPAAGIRVLLAAVVMCAGKVLPAGAVQLVLTSGLEGRLTVAETGQDDALIRLAGAIAMERARPGTIYLDLGNAFYPGVLSKYSYGAVMLDYFRFSDCSATVVSSGDLRLGADGLAFQQKDFPTGLLSANIFRANAPLFKPYQIVQADGRQVALVGLSSVDLVFDIAEQKELGVQIRTPRQVLPELISQLDSQGVQDVIVLSGLSVNDNLALLAAHPRIGLIISGGDNSGVIGKSAVSRIELPDRRSIVFVPSGRNYCRINYDPAGRTVVSYDVQRPDKTVENMAVRELRQRIGYWRRRYQAEKSEVLVQLDKTVQLDDQRLAHVLRDYSRSDVSLVMPGSVRQGELPETLTPTELGNRVYDEFNVFEYRLRGAHLKTVIASGDFLQSGLTMEESRVTKWMIQPSMRFLPHRVCMKR